MSTHILWTADSGDRLELCRLEEGDVSARLTGSALGIHRGAPYEIRYEVETGSDWVTRAAVVRVAGPEGEQAIELVRTEEGWSTGRSALHGYGDCLDVDLELCPATNTLPIRRLELQVGDSADVAALWISVPDLAVERVEQAYERMSADTYVYRAGSFSAALIVDEDGLVLRYEGYFDTLARTRL